MENNFKKSIIVIVFVVILIISVFATYFFMDQENKRTIEELSEEYTAQIDNLENQIEDLADTWMDYDKLMMQGLAELCVALENEGYASSDYNDASANYEGFYFEVAESYADNADIMYVYASDSYRNAKAYFKEAKSYVTNEKTRRLAEFYYNLTEYGAQMMDEMHQACEYFSSACNCYYNDLWELGDSEIEKMNEHIVIHDDIVPDYNDCSSDINVLLDTF